MQISNDVGSLHTMLQLMDRAMFVNSIDEVPAGVLDDDVHSFLGSGQGLLDLGDELVHTLPVRVLMNRARGRLALSPARVTSSIRSILLKTRISGT